MLMPKKMKYRKVQKGRIVGMSKGARTIAFGEYGLMAMESGRVSARQIEAVRVTISRKLKKVGEMFLRMFPDKPVTKKPAETRMGKGKGNPELWVSVVKRGRVILELSGISREEAKEILHGASYKLSIKTKFIDKNTDLAAVTEVAVVEAQVN
jgi:large subunit ribosomal protein L16